MARAKSPTAHGRSHEEAMVKLFEFDNARRSRSSGSQWNDNKDVVGDSFIMECESTYNKSYSLKREFFEEALRKSGIKFPTLGVEFADANPRNNLQLVVMLADDAAMLLEKYREE